MKDPEEELVVLMVLEVILVFLGVVLVVLEVVMVYSSSSLSEVPREKIHTARFRSPEELQTPGEDSVSRILRRIRCSAPK